MKEQNYVPWNDADGIANISTEMHLLWNLYNLKQYIGSKYVLIRKPQLT